MSLQLIYTVKNKKPCMCAGPVSQEICPPQKFLPPGPNFLGNLPPGPNFLGNLSPPSEIGLYESWITLPPDSDFFNRRENA